MNANSDPMSKNTEPFTEPAEELLEEKPNDADYTAGSEQDEPMDKSFEQQAIRLTMLVQEQNDRYLRLLAEYDNFRKRSQKEREMIFPEAFATCASAVFTGS